MAAMLIATNLTLGTKAKSTPEIACNDRPGAYRGSGLA
jgi:hypothetical protein